MRHTTENIRPAARLLKTIGQDLIKDVYAAIVELVKNSYDADSPDSLIQFEFKDQQNRLLIRVEDNGHGMDPDTVVNKWLVPATSDKLERKISDGGRVLQGRKGIGRFAASVLGERILLETTQAGTTTSLILDMESLDEIEYLDEFQVEVNVEETGDPDGTVIEIEKDNVNKDTVSEIWNSDQIRKLLIELRSLIAPEDVFNAAKKEGYVVNFSPFEIKLQFKNFPVEDYEDRVIPIRPFPVLDLYDYRISGSVSETGIAKLKYENQNIPSLPSELIDLKISFKDDSSRDFPGEVYIDLRVYDRDPDSITKLINRGLKDPDSGYKVGKLEARRILNEYFGVGVYREQFRIRPYGEQSFDWLDLDKKRVQNPSRKIGHNQIMGFVYVRPEEESGLTEKSARDGLTETKEFFGLSHIISVFINQLEVRRYRYREKAQKGGRRRSVEEDVNNLFNFENVVKKVKRDLDDLGMKAEDVKAASTILQVTLEKEKQEKLVIAQRIKDTIALYQGQATLGKITHVLLHEGRKNIKYLSETIPRIVKWSGKLSGKPDQDLLEKLQNRSSNVLSHTKVLAHLFKKIEPLARTRRAPVKIFSLEDVIENALAIFSYDIGILSVKCSIDANEPKLNIVANEMDLITVFSNLIENSMYWLEHIKGREREIQIRIYKEKNDIVVEYYDNGPGFQGENIELMFEPGYSMKPDGTGLGLALAGEAMARIGGTIEARKSDVGALFDITFKGKA
jgi:signal transduction histidine kinase